MKTYFRGAVAAIALTAAAMTTTVAQAADTIKVGILHSLSGTMAISETALRDTVLIADRDAPYGRIFVVSARSSAASQP